MSNPLGLHAGFTRILPLPERVLLLRDAGFDATALWWEHQREDIRAIRDRAPDLVRRAGLALDHLHAPYFACNDLWSENDADRAAAVTLHLGWIDDCRRHEIPRLVMHVTRGRNPPPPSAGSLDTFRRLADAAEVAGVTLALENTHCPDHLQFLFTRIDSPAIALCYDIAHDRLHSAHPGDLLARWAHRTSVLHLSDTDGRRDWHWLPGDGNTDFAGTLGALHAKFPGAFTLESVHRGAAHELPTYLGRAHAAAVTLRDHFLSPSHQRPIAHSSPSIAQAAPFVEQL